MQPVEEVVNAVQPVEEIVNAVQPVEEVVNAVQPVEEVVNAVQPVDEIVNAVQPVDEIVNAVQPVEEIMKEEMVKEAAESEEAEKELMKEDTEKEARELSLENEERSAIPSTSVLAEDPTMMIEECTKNMDIVPMEMEVEEKEKEVGEGAEKVNSQELVEKNADNEAEILTEKESEMKEELIEEPVKEVTQQPLEVEEKTTTPQPMEQPREEHTEIPSIPTPERTIPVKKMLEMEKQLMLNEELKTLVSLLPDSDDTDESWSDDTPKTSASRSKAKETYKPVILGVYVDKPEMMTTPPRASKKREVVENESPFVTPSKQVSVAVSVPMVPMTTPVRPQPKEKALEVSPTKVMNECFVVGNCLPDIPAESSFFHQLQERSDTYPVAVRRLLKEVAEERRRFDVLLQRQTSQFQAAYFMERSKWNAVCFPSFADV